MAIALVTQAVGSGTSSANQAITASATVGNFLCLFYARSGGLATGAVTGITDTGGNTWVSIPCRGAVSGGTNTRIEFWYCQVTADPGTITVASATAQTNSWNISEWSGLATTTPIDASSPDGSATTSSTTVTTPTISPANTTDLILAAYHCGQTTSSGLTAAFTAMTDFDDAAVGSGRAAYLIDTGSGPYAASWTLGVAKACGVITVAITAAATASTPTSPAPFIPPRNYMSPPSLAQRLTRPLGPQTYQVQLTGNLSFVGTTGRAVKTTLSGALSFTGAVTKRIAHTVIGSLSFVGSLATASAHHFNQAVSGSLSFVGNLTTVKHTFSTKSLTGSLSFVGALSTVYTPAPPSDTCNVTLVNQTVGSGASAANQNIAATATVGNFLVLLYARSGGLATGTVTSVTDTGGNTWSVAAVTRGAVSGASNTRIEVWTCQVTASPGTITVNSGTAQTNAWNLSEWSGIVGSNENDVDSPNYSGNASSTSQPTPTIVTNGADLVIAGWHFGQTTTSGLTAGWTALTDFDDAAAGSGRGAYLIAAAGSYGASLTLGTAQAGGVVTVSFKCAAAPPPPPPPPVGQCLIRVTPIKGTVMRLVQTDVTGVALGTLTVVTKSFTQVQMSPTYGGGVDYFERSADGIIILNAKTPPVLARLQLQVNLCLIDPAAAPLMLSARELLTGAPVSGVGFATTEGPSTPHYSLEVWQRVAGTGACDSSGAQLYVYNAWPHCYNTQVSGSYTVNDQRSELSFSCETASVFDASGPWTAYLPTGAAGQPQASDRWLWNITTVAPPPVT